MLGIEVAWTTTFFELRGNSSYAVRIATATRSIEKPSVLIKNLYAHPAIHDFVTSIDYRIFSPDITRRACRTAGPGQVPSEPQNAGA